MFTANGINEYIKFYIGKSGGFITGLALAIIIFGSGYQIYNCIEPMVYSNGMYVRKDDVKEMVQIVEQDSITTEFTNNSEYTNMRKKLLNAMFISKTDLANFVGLIKKQDTGNNLKYMYVTKYDETKNRQSSSKTEENVSMRTIKSGDLQMPHLIINNFNTGVAKQLAECMEKCKDSPNIVLDLRWNPGGDIQELVKAADVFLPENIEVITTQDRFHKTTWYTQNTDSFKGEIIVLVNKDTASCAEALALVLKKSLPDKVHLLGNNTTGKGVGQQVHSFPESGVKLAVVEFNWNVRGADVTTLQEFLKQDGQGITYNEGKDYAEGIKLAFKR